MIIKDFIKKEIDIDVYDDVTDELAIAFCGPLILTEAGEKEFSDVLDYEIEEHSNCAIVHVDDADENVWKKRLNRAIVFFNSAAGYCSVSEYEKWFQDDSD